MAECLDCRKNCLQPVSDYCVQYTGPTIAAVGIENGMWYDQLTVQLANTLADYINTTVNLSCLYDNTCGSCDPDALVPDAVQIIIEKLCSLTTDDFVYTGSMYCIGAGSISAEGSKLTGRGFNYSGSQVGNSTSLAVDLAIATADLPPGHVVSKYRVVVSGKKKKGKTIVLDTDQPTAAVTVDNDRYPLVADVNIRVNTPTGEIDLNQIVSISNPLNTKKTGILYVRDFSRTSPAGLTQSSFNELVAAQVCQNKQDIEQVKNIDIEGCENIQYPSKDFKSVLGVHSSALCDHDGRIEDLEKVKFRECTDSCGENLLDLTPQEAWTKVTDLICEMQSKMTELREELASLKEKMSCCDCG